MHEFAPEKATAKDESELEKQTMINFEYLWFYR